MYLPLWTSLLVAMHDDIKRTSIENVFGLGLTNQIEAAKKYSWPFGYFSSSTVSNE